MTRHALSLAVLCAVACSKESAPSATQPPPSNTASAAVTTTPQGSTSLDAAAITSGPIVGPPAPPFVAASVPEIKPPANLACSFTTTSYAPPGNSMSLQIDARSSPFAYVTSGRVKLFVPTGTSAAVVEIVRGGYEIHGLVHGDTPSPAGLEGYWRLGALALHATKPYALGGVFVVTPKTSLSFVSGAAGHLVPTVVGGSVIPKDAFEARPCEDFSLDEVKFDARASIPKGKLATKRFVRKGNVPIAATATGAVTAQLSPDLAGAEVKVIEEASGRARVVFESAEGIVVGWVDGKDLLDKPEESLFFRGDLGLSGVGDGGPGIGAPPSFEPYECGTDVRLYADMTAGSAADIANAPYAAVGSIRKSTRFQIFARPGALRRVFGVKLEGVSVGGWLAVADADLSKCTRIGK